MYKFSSTLSVSTTICCVPASQSCRTHCPMSAILIEAESQDACTTSRHGRVLRRNSTTPATKMKLWADRRHMHLKGDADGLRAAALAAHLPQIPASFSKHSSSSRATRVWLAVCWYPPPTSCLSAPTQTLESILDQLSCTHCMMFESARLYEQILSTSIYGK